MKKIELSRGLYATVDDEDFGRLMKYNWYAKSHHGNEYAVRHSTEKGQTKTIRMHREIMGLRDGEQIDHIDRNGLHNEKNNFRFCSTTQNLQNRGLQNHNTSGFKGVSWDAKRNKWIVQISANKKRTKGGHFTCIIKAAKKYNELAKELHGAYAVLNKIE